MDTRVILLIVVWAYSAQGQGTGSDCSRPNSNWCRHNRASYQGSTDCDGDGYVDQFCTFRGANGIKGALLSLNNCTETQYEMPDSSGVSCASVKGDCATDGDCRYKEKTNSDLKTKCDKSLPGTSYSTRGPDITASTAVNPYSSKTLYKCGCQDNYIQKSDNWRQEGCVECTSSDSSKCGKNMECKDNACICLTTQNFSRIDGNDHTKGCDLQSPEQLCTTKSGTVWNSGKSTCECKPNLDFKNDQNTDEGCVQKCKKSLDCDDVSTCTNNECSSILDDEKQTCSECSQDQCRTKLMENDVRKGYCVSDEVILLVGGYEKDGSPVSDAKDIAETIFTYDCDRPDFPEEEGITFNTAALTADPIQKVITCGGSTQKKCFHLYQEEAFSKAMKWKERTNKLTSEISGNAGENSVTMPNGVFIVAGSGHQSLERTLTSNEEKQWSGTQQVPEGATFKDACTIRISDKEFVVLGGTSPDVDYSKKVMKYHTGDNEWTELTDLKMARRAHACALYNGTQAPNPYIVIAGGEGQGGVLTSTEIYHFKTAPATSEMGGDLNTARWAHGMVFVMKPSPRLLTLGGFSNGDEFPPEALNTMEEWDPVGKKWNAIETTMKKKRAFFGVVVAPREAVCCPPKDEDWVLGNGAESCSDVCFRRGQVCDNTKPEELHSDSDATETFNDAVNPDKSFNSCDGGCEKVDYATLPGPVVHKDTKKCYANKKVDCNVATRNDKIRPLCYCKNG